MCLEGDTLQYHLSDFTLAEKFHFRLNQIRGWVDDGFLNLNKNILRTASVFSVKAFVCQVYNFHTLMCTAFNTSGFDLYAL